MNYNVVSVLIICAVGVVSFFVAELVLPDQNAVARQDAPAAAEERAEPAPAVAEPSGGPPAAAAANNAPAAAPIAPPKARVPVFNVKAAPPNTMAATIDPKNPPKPAPVPEAKTAPTTAMVASPPPTQTAPPAKPDTAQRQAPRTASGISATNVAVCASVVEKTPVGISNRFSKNAPQVYFFTLITGARDTTAILHRWYHNGKLVQTSPLSVRSAYWRTHSKRNLQSPNDPDPTGDWRVDVVEGLTGQVIGSTRFTVGD